jgi:hypothetical protein
VYVRKGDLNETLTHYRKTIIGRKRTLEKQYSYYYDSLNLLASIYRAINDLITAAIYGSFILFEFSPVKYFITASFFNDAKIVKISPKKGASFIVINKNGWTPLNTATNSGHLEVVKFLLDKEADFIITNENN